MKGKEQNLSALLILGRKISKEHEVGGSENEGKVFVFKGRKGVELEEYERLTLTFFYKCERPSC